MNDLLWRRRRQNSLPWYETEYPGSTYAIRFSRVTASGDRITPSVSKTGVAVSWDFGDGTPLLSSNNGAHTYSLSGTFDLTIVFYDDVTSLTTLYLSNTGVTGDVGGLAPLTSLTYLNLYNTGVTGDVGGLAPLTSLTYLNLSNTGVNVDSAANGFWAARNNFTAANLYVHIGGTNPNPSGIYQSACPPTTPLEKIYNLANGQCTGDTFNTQTWVY